MYDGVAPVGVLFNLTETHYKDSIKIEGVPPLEKKPEANTIVIDGTHGEGIVYFLKSAFFSFCRCLFGGGGTFYAAPPPFFVGGSTGEEPSPPLKRVSRQTPRSKQN